MPPLEASPDEQFRPNPSPRNMQALRCAFDELAPSFLTLSLHITGCPESAEDMVQEVFLEELAQARRFASDDLLAGRLTERLAQHLDTFRPPGGNRPKVSGLEEAAALPLRWTPLSEAQQLETLNQLSNAIDQLPEKYREVVRLSLVESRSSREIGIQLGRPPGTVRSQLARGLDRLRNSLPAALGVTILCVNAEQSFAASPSPADAMHAVRTRFLTQASRIRALRSSPVGATFAVAVAILAVGVVGAFLTLNAPGEDLSPVQTSDQSLVSGQTQSTPQALLAPAGETVGLREIRATEAPEPAVPRAHVFGKIVGPDGKGIEGAEVTLFGWKRWDSAKGASKLPGEQAFGWTLKTNRTGDYSFDVQVPKHSPPYLRVEAGPGYTTRDIWFDATVCNQAPLWAGENEIAPVQLQFAGNITGTLLTDAGLPAYPASMLLTPGSNPLSNATAYTDQNGVFHAVNIIAGQQELIVQYGGQVRATELVWVNRDETTDMKEFRLPKVTTLPVVVTDMGGVPLQGATLRFPHAKADSTMSLGVVGVGTDDQGMGTVRVLDSETSALFVSLSGYVSEKPSYPLKPNQALLKVRMKLNRGQAFRAIDARTGNTLTDFGMAALNKVNGLWVASRWSQPKAIDDTGAKVISTIDGEWVEVQCHGYESKWLDPMASPDSTVVVPLKPLMKITGRVVSNGRPVPMANIELAGGVVRNGSGSSPGDLRPNFSSLDSAMAWFRAGPSGQFELSTFPIPDLTYRLLATTEDGLTVERWFTLAEFTGDKVNLGDLDLQASGSVKVSLQMPAGITSRGGIAFLLDLSHGATAGIPDPNGEFTLDGIGPGKHTLLLREHPALSAETPPFEFSVVAGHTTNLSIDLHPFALTHQDLRLLDNGTPLSGRKVVLSPGDPRTPGNRTDWKGGYFGTTDKNGRVHGKVPAAGMAEIWVLEPGQEKRLTKTLVDLTPQAQDPVTVDY